MANVVEMRSWNYPYVLVALFPLLFDITQGDRSIWQLTYVPKANFMNSSYGNISAVPTHSDLTCILAATKMFWPHLACFVNGFCLMTMYQTVPRSNSAGITDPVECMTHFRENAECDFGNGTVVSDGAIWPFYCGNETCSRGKITESFTHPSYPSTCKSPFSNFPGLGCVLLLQTPGTACDSRQACYNVGGKLAKIDDSTSRTALTLFAERNANGKNFWVGLQRIGGILNWTWDLGGQISYGSPIWNTATYMTTWKCASASPTSSNTWALLSKFCNSTDMQYNALCEIPV